MQALGQRLYSLIGQPPKQHPNPARKRSSKEIYSCSAAVKIKTTRRGDEGQGTEAPFELPPPPSQSYSHSELGEGEGPVDSTTTNKQTELVKIILFLMLKKCNK